MSNMASTQTTVPLQLEDIRLRRRRRQSTPALGSSPRPPLHTCHSFPSLALEALDLSTPSPKQTLASLRFIVLQYLAQLEESLAQLENPLSEISDVLKAKGEHTIEEARAWAREALELLTAIRKDVCSQLPELHFVESVESFRSRVDGIKFPGLDDVRSHMDDVRARFPEMPDMPDVRSHLPDLTEMVEDLRLRFGEMDVSPLSYVHTLSSHLQSLSSHLSSLDIPSLAPSAMLSDLLDLLMDAAPDVTECENIIERAARELAHAVKQSSHGDALITYEDLPPSYRNNPYVRCGYRFIPLERWPLIVFSLIESHNEILNIHTHLVPFIFWGINAIPFFNAQAHKDVPEAIFMGFALLCLFSSSLWHCMSGCAHENSMETCAKIDYVGIGWLISASVGTVVYYGFQCHPGLRNAFLVFCLLSGIAGNVFPFMDWFNKYKYRLYRVGFFLGLAFSAIAPLTTMAWMYTARQMFTFMSPVIPSLVSYLTGLSFYASHFPERLFSNKWSARLDNIGAGSHAIWHAFIVLAISQHKAAIGQMRGGIETCST